METKTISFFTSKQDPFKTLKQDTQVSVLGIDFILDLTALLDCTYSDVGGRTARCFTESFGVEGASNNYSRYITRAEF